MIFKKQFKFHQNCEMRQKKKDNWVNHYTSFNY